MGIVAAAMLILQAGVAAPSLDSYYTESIFPGRVLGPETAIGLCAETDAAAAEAMREIVQIASEHGNYRDKICIFPILKDWKVVRKISDRCEISSDGEWCAIEAHTVLAEQNGKQKYALILVKEDQLN